MSLKLDLSENLIVVPFKNGVTLVRPDEVLNDHYFSLKQILEFNFNAFILGADSNTILKLNEPCVLTCALQQFSSLKKIQGKKMENLFKKEGVMKIIQEGLTVCAEKQMKIFEEQVMCLNNLNFSVLALKFPLYTTDNKIAAILGFSIVSDPTIFPGTSSLSEGLMTLTQTGLLSKEQNDRTIKGKIVFGQYLSKQELKCLQLLITGLSAKIIARNLSLSPRTVESHLENLKHKFNVTTKYQLIEKINNFLKINR